MAPENDIPEEALTVFRKRLLEDQTYRTKFAADPAQALRDVGIDIPKGTKLPKIDLKELNERVAKIKDHFEGDLDELSSTKKIRGLSGRDATKLNTVGNIGIADFGKVNPKVGGAGVYTISAFGTLDW